MTEIYIYIWYAGRLYSYDWIKRLLTFIISKSRALSIDQSKLEHTWKNEDKNKNNPQGFLNHLSSNAWAFKSEYLQIRLQLSFKMTHIPNFLNWNAKSNVFCACFFEEEPEAYEFERRIKKEYRQKIEWKVAGFSFISSKCWLIPKKLWTSIENI